MPTKVCLVKAMWSSGHVWMWELDCEESWVLKNWCFWTVKLEKTLESPLDCKEIKPVHAKENHSWIFIGSTDAEAETATLWPPDVKNWLFGKDPDAGNVWRREEKGMTEDEVAGWHHRLDRHEFEQAAGVGDGLGSLAWYSPWGHKESDMTERMTWNWNRVWNYINYQILSICDFHWIKTIGVIILANILWKSGVPGGAFLLREVLCLMLASCLPVGYLASLGKMCLACSVSLNLSYSCSLCTSSLMPPP